MICCKYIHKTIYLRGKLDSDIVRFLFMINNDQWTFHKNCLPLKLVWTDQQMSKNMYDYIACFMQVPYSSIVRSFLIFTMDHMTKIGRCSYGVQILTITSVKCPSKTTYAIKRSLHYVQGEIKTKHCRLSAQTYFR